MKKLFTLLLFLAMSTYTFAQSMSVESFTKDERDMDARVGEPELDQNGKKRALIKVETTERGFVFDTGISGYGLVKEKTGQLWVYVPKGVQKLEITHNQLGTIPYPLPMSIDEATVYRMKLTTAKITQVVEESTGGQYFALACNPINAIVVFDDGSPMTLSESGFLRKFLSFGEHTYRISAPNYESMEGKVTIGNDRVNKSITLTPQFGYISIKTTPAATLSINGVPYGNTPYNSTQLPFGEYNITLSTPNYETISKTVVIDKPEQNVVINELMVYTLSNIRINTQLRGTSIYINEELMGENIWTGDLSPGEYIVRCSKESHRDIKRKMVVERGKPLNISIEALTPIYGKLDIDSPMDNVVVSIDGVKRGTAPNIFNNVLIGRRTVEYSRDGYVTKQEDVTIEEGRITRRSIAPLAVEEQFGWIIITTTQGADVVITNTKTGKTYHGDGATKSPRLDYGNYNVQISKLNHKTITQRVTINQPKQEIEIRKELEYTSVEKFNNKQGLKYFAIGQYEYGSSQSSYGVMAGILSIPNAKDNLNATYGAYLKYMNSFTSTPDTTIDCTNEGYSGKSFTSTSISSYHSFTIGFIAGSSNGKYMGYFGLGKGVKKMIWETTDGEYAFNTDQSIKYLAIDMGVMYRYGRMLFTFGGEFVPADEEGYQPYSYKAVTLGVGLAF